MPMIELMLEPIGIEDCICQHLPAEDTYSRRPHIEPVIKEWVEWSCQQAGFGWSQRARASSSLAGQQTIS